MRNYVAGILLAALLFTLSMMAGLDISQAATPANVPDVECYPWADAEGWTVTRCEDWGNGESCLIASSGFMACRFD